MGLVDTAVVGRVSAEAQAAVGLGNSLIFTVCFLGMGVLLALDPLISQAVGAKDFATARTWSWQGVWLSLLVSVALIPVLAFSPRILPLFEVAPGVASLAREYVVLRLPGVVALMLFVSARSYLQNLGVTRPIFMAMAVANVCNFLFDLVLVFGWGPVPALGSNGAAIATTLCSFVQWAVLLPAISKRVVDGGTRAFNLAHAKTALKLGLPIGLQMLVEASVFNLAGLLAAGFSAEQAAAHQAALQWASVTFCVAVGIGNAASTRVGWAIGAGDLVGARRAGFVSLGMSVAFMGSASLAFLFAPAPFARLMTTDVGVLPHVLSLLVVVAAFQVSDGLQAVAAGALRGASDTRASFIANVLGHWCVGLPVAWWLGVHERGGVVGIWWGLSAGLTAVALTLVTRFTGLMRHRLQVAASC